jgi:hypothetical protein
VRNGRGAAEECSQEVFKEAKLDLELFTGPVYRAKLGSYLLACLGGADVAKVPRGFRTLIDSNYLAVYLITDLWRQVKKAEGIVFCGGFPPALTSRNVFLDHGMRDYWLRRSCERLDVDR